MAVCGHAVAQLTPLTNWASRFGLIPKPSLADALGANNRTRVLLYIYIYLVNFTEIRHCNEIFNIMSSSASSSQFVEDVPPGTVHIIDVENILDVKKGSSNIILIPPPSPNPNDPLRWSQRKKNLQFWFLWIFSFFGSMTGNWLGPYWTVLVDELHTTYTKLNITSALCFLFMGIGCVVFQPTAMKLGRRFVYLVCCLLSILANTVGATTKNINYLYVSNIFTGLAGASVDSLVEISSTDVFFLHERATKLSFLILALYAGSDIGPAISGYVGSNTNFRRVYWILAVIMAVIFVCMVFLLEDTTLYREELSTEENILQQIRSHASELNTLRNDQEEKYPVISQKTPRHDTDDSSIDYSIPKRSLWQRRKLFELEYSDPRPWFTIFIRPFFMIYFPPVVWGAVVYGVQMMWLSLLATTQSQIYNEQYGFSTSSTGLTNLAPLVGSVIGMVYGGPFVDWLSVKLAKRNNGILEPEFRLWAMVVPTIFNAGGLLAYGLPANAKAPWPLSVVLGQGVLGFAMSSTGPISLTYAIDSYPKLASEGLVVMMFIRNMIGCGFTFAIEPWLDRNGLFTTTWLMFMISVVVNGSFLIMIIWGRRLRIWTAKYYHKMTNPKYGNLF